MFVEERRRAAYSGFIQTGWFSEYYARQKKLPKLDDELHQIEKPESTVLSGAEAIKFMKAATLTQGGELIDNNTEGAKT